MRRFSLFVAALLVLFLLCMPAQSQPAKPGDPVYALVETSLKTAGKQIRMYAMDHDPKTYFHSSSNAGKSDHFTLTFEKAVAVKSIVVTTGKPEGGDKLDEGILEASSDGKKFEELGKFKNGTAEVKPGDKKIMALRIKPTADLQHPLAIREIAIQSDPPVATYKYPVEYTLDVADAPEMKPWGENVVKICERAYQWIGDELQSPGFKPTTKVTMSLKNSYNGVAAAGGGKITGSVKYFKGKPNDVGAMVHESVHIIQQYKGKGNPGWLVEGVADWIRFFKYEPGKIGNLNINTAKYNASYRVTARFLDYVSVKHDKLLVRKLNQAMREGKYKEEIWKDLTGKTVQQLDEDWRASLKTKGETAGVARAIGQGGIWVEATHVDRGISVFLR